MSLIFNVRFIEGTSDHVFLIAERIGDRGQVLNLELIQSEAGEVRK